MRMNQIDNKLCIKRILQVIRIQTLCYTKRQRHSNSDAQKTIPKKKNSQRI